MFDKIDINKMGEVLKEVQDNVKKMQDESEAKQFTAKSGGGMVKVVMNGKSEVIDIDIDNSLLEDKESLQILLISAINDAIKMVEEDRKLSASQMLGGFGDLSKFINR